MFEVLELLGSHLDDVQWKMAFAWIFSMALLLLELFDDINVG